jgi:hypothetical protein
MYFTIFNWGAPGVQSFRVEDAHAKPLAHYSETGQVAAARKDNPEWSSIYVGAAQGLSDDLLNRIARESGAYVGGPAGQYLAMNGDFACVHALKTGDYTLTLPPGRQRVVEAETGRVLSTNAPAFTFPAQVQKTYWFFFE